ncbi:UNKNOWN [Stylonychia lemnae]|uniref:Arrestin-like N-terminal domain-containing protein n=1 Tax=Stylonychia lemnae TaxID=5949 RepID=A0A077ZX36_STYLE|nr:UNKNOWN [Stylonychia lemnae]|eukprot:CDW74481.1 UNKNOWN [Stylonychia lemnae]
MGNRQTLEKIPIQIPFSHGFIYVQTNKQSYYPGEEIYGVVSLMVNKPMSQIDHSGVDKLEIRLKGKETFKYKVYSQRDQQKSCSNHFLIFDNAQPLAYFKDSTIAIGQYEFSFKIKIPEEENGNKIPASYFSKQHLGRSGKLKIRIRYSIEAILKGQDRRLNNAERTIGKFSKRFFISKPPVQPKQDFPENNSYRLRGWFKVKGSNILESRFERNYYLTDDKVTVKTIVDNRRCLTAVSKVIVKLVRTIKCEGRYGNVFIHVEEIARNHGPGVGPQVLSNYLEEDHRVIIDLILDDPSLKSTKLDEIRDKFPRPYKPEDVVFAQHLQPSTKGNKVEVTYHLQVTREFDEGKLFRVKDVPGMIIPLTLNPSVAQVNGHCQLEFPDFWRSDLISCESVDLKINDLLNREYDPEQRRLMKQNQREVQSLQHLSHLQQNQENLISQQEVSQNNANDTNQLQRPLLHARLFGR